MPRAAVLALGTSPHLMQVFALTGLRASSHADLGFFGRMDAAIAGPVANTTTIRAFWLLAAY